MQPTPPPGMSCLHRSSAASDDQAAMTDLTRLFVHEMTARLRSGDLDLEWSQPAVAASELRGGREVAPPRFDWAGLDYVFGPDFKGARYAITVGYAK